MELAIKERVEQLRRGFIERPGELKGDTLEVILRMLEEIIGEIERPKEWYVHDRWGEFRRRMNGEPSPLELACNLKLREGSVSGGGVTLSDRKERFRESMQSNKYEVRG